MTRFLSTLSLRRATNNDSLAGSQSVFLSTLSLRRATDVRDVTVVRPEDFYPRSPCGERRSAALPVRSRSVFLSTLSLRRATPRRHPGGHLGHISIHALLAESDCLRRCASISSRQFLSTLSLRRATHDDDGGQRCHRNFYPRSPCGERPSCGWQGQAR